MKHFKLITGLIGLYALFILVTYLFKIGGDAFLIVSMILTIVTAIIPIVAGYFALKEFGIGTAQGKSIVTLMVGITFWGIADTIWTIIEPTSFTFLDVLYIVGYFLLTAGIFYGIKAYNPGFLGRHKTLLIALSVISFPLMMFIAIRSVDWSAEVLDIAYLASSWAYLVGDYVLLIGIISIVISVFYGQYSKPWMIIGVGIIFTLISDIVFAMAPEEYAVGQFLDVLWFYTYLMLAIGFLLMKHISDKLQEQLIAPIKQKKR